MVIVYVVKCYFCYLEMFIVNEIFVYEVVGLDIKIFVFCFLVDSYF